MLFDSTLSAALTTAVIFVMFWWVTFPTVFLSAMVGYKLKSVSAIACLFLVGTGCLLGFLMSYRVYPTDSDTLLKTVIWLTPVYVLLGFIGGRLTLLVLTALSKR